MGSINTGSSSSRHEQDDGIDASNAARLATMSTAELAEALDEVGGRLTAQQIAFLRARGAAAGGQTAGGGATAGAATAAAVAGSNSRGGAAAASSPSGTQRALLPATMPRPRGVPKPSTAGAAHQAAAGGGARACDEDQSLVARVRWGLDGEVVGVREAGEVESGEQVLRRDVLRSDEGLTPTGYTASELLLLARSAVPAQRCAALGMLVALVARARPSAADVTERGGLRSRHVALPEHVLQQERDRVRAGGQPQQQLLLDWSSVWDHLLLGLRVVSHLRLALDDEHGAVVAAAADACAAVVGGGGCLGDACVYEASDLMPLVGWPAARPAYLHRSHPAAVWEGEAGGSEEETRQRRQQEEEEEGRSPEDVACADPVAGLLRMCVLQRVRYVLEVLQLPAATQPLLALLCAMVRADRSAAVAVLETPRLAAVLSRLAAELPLLPGAGSAQAPPQAASAGRSTAAAPAHPGAMADQLSTGGRLALAMLLRLLCQSSREAAAGALSCGLLAHLHPLVALHPCALSGGGGSSSSGSVVEGLQLKLEALRTWRVCANVGLTLPPGLSGDDLHAPLVRLMDPTCDAVAASGAGGADAAGGAAAAADSSLRWAVSAEIHLLLAALVAHSASPGVRERGGGGGGMISPGCAAAVAQDALAWLRPSDAQLRAVRVQLEEAASASQPMSLPVPLLALAADGGSCSSSLKAAAVMHPSLALPPAALRLCCVGAALQLLATYWATIPPGQPVFGVVQAQLSASRLLLTSHDAAAAGEGVTGGSLLALLEKQQQQQQEGAAAAVADGLTTGVALLASPLIAAAGCGALSSLLALSRVVFHHPSDAWRSQAGELAARVEAACGRGLVSAAAAQPTYKALWPWACGRLQLQQLAVRLFLQAADAMAAAAVVAVPGGGGGGSSPGSAFRAELADACVSVLVLSPPGADAQCLSALKLLSRAIDGQLSKATEALQQLPTVSPSLAATAAGRSPPSDAAAAAQPPAPYPCPVNSSSVGGSGSGGSEYWQHPGAVAAVLFASYAASWLSLLSAQHEAHANGGVGGQRAPSSVGQQPPPPPYLEHATSSRLPLPVTWPLMEAHSLPRSLLALPPPPQGSGSDDAPPPPPHPVGCALLLVLSMRLSGSRLFGASQGCVSRGQLLAATLALVYVFAADELVAAEEEARRPGRGASGATAAADSRQRHQQAAEFSGEHWRLPLVRWSAAAFTHQLLLGSGQTQQPPSPPLLPPDSKPLVDQLCERFVSASFGDPLFGAHLALALLPAAATPLRTAVWGALSQASCLHLLPRTEDCIGGRAAYLQAAPVGPFTLDATEAEAALQLCSTMARSLVNGELDKASGVRSLSADLAAHELAACVFGAAGCDRPGGAASGRGGGGGSSSSSAAAAAVPVLGTGSSMQQQQQALRAQQLARMILRDAAAVSRCRRAGGPTERLQLVLRAGTALGCTWEKQKAALQTACQGDDVLLEVVDSMSPPPAVKCADDTHDC